MSFDVSGFIEKIDYAFQLKKSEFSDNESVKYRREESLLGKEQV